MELLKNMHNQQIAAVGRRNGPGWFGLMQWIKACRWSSINSRRDAAGGGLKKLKGIFIRIFHQFM